MGGGGIPLMGYCGRVWDGGITPKKGACRLGVDTRLISW
jgi:hypothetical protein